MLCLGRCCAAAAAALLADKSIGIEYCQKIAEKVSPIVLVMTYSFCHINYDLFPINCVIFNKIPHTVYEIQMLKNDTVVLRRHSQHRFDSQLGGQFVLKVATIFTNTRP